MYTQHVDFIAHILCWHFWVYEAIWCSTLFLKAACNAKAGILCSNRDASRHSRPFLQAAICWLHRITDPFRNVCHDSGRFGISCQIHWCCIHTFRSPMENSHFLLTPHSLQLAVQRITGGNDCWSWSHNAQSSCSRCFFCRAENFSMSSTLHWNRSIGSYPTYVTYYPFLLDFNIRLKALNSHIF